MEKITRKNIKRFYFIFSFFFSLNSNAQMVTTFAGNGGQSTTDGTVLTASFYNPNGIAIDSYGTIYISDYNGSKIRKITTTGVVSTIAGSRNSWFCRWCWHIS